MQVSKFNKWATEKLLLVFLYLNYKYYDMSEYKLPLYIAKVSDGDEGITAISFVQEPAVECGFLQFSKQKEKLKFSVVDENNRKVIAPIMRCDFPIYRRTEDGFEYFIMYNKETIEVMARKMFSDNISKNMNMEHNPNNIMNGVYLEELFIKNVEKGINPKGFEDIENYSLFGVYTIENNDVWDSIKNGTFTGISLEGIFSFDEKDYEVLVEILSMLKECNRKGIK